MGACAGSGPEKNQLGRKNQNTGQGSGALPGSKPGNDPRQDSLATNPTNIHQLDKKETFGAESQKPNSGWADKVVEKQNEPLNEKVKEYERKKDREPSIQGELNQGLKKNVRNSAEKSPLKNQQEANNKNMGLGVMGKGEQPSNAVRQSALSKEGKKQSQINVHISDFKQQEQKQHTDVADKKDYDKLSAFRAISEVPASMEEGGDSTKKKEKERASETFEFYKKKEAMSNKINKTGEVLVEENPLTIKDIPSHPLQNGLDDSPRKQNVYEQQMFIESFQTGFELPLFRLQLSTGDVVYS